MYADSLTKLLILDVLLYQEFFIYGKLLLKFQKLIKKKHQPKADVSDI